MTVIEQNRQPLFIDRVKIGKLLRLLLPLMGLAVILSCGVESELGISTSADEEEGQVAGVFGRITDSAGANVEGATVILIPSTDINTISLDVNTLSSTATDDEPLEDLVNNTNSYQTAVTDADGNYSFETITEGEYFIYVAPGGEDSTHLPGGSLCREARDLTDTGLEKDIEISTTPSSEATYVGSSTCLTCHTDRETIMKTGHFNGFRVPGSDSGLQDISAFDGFDSGLDKFNGTTTVYFHSYDSTRGFDKYKTAETDPGSNVIFKIRLLKSGSTYQMEFTNVKNASDPNNGIKYDVELTYGGAVYKQRYVAKIGTSRYILPLQYQNTGSESFSPRTRKVWRDYHAATSWYNESTTLFKTPATSKSFDNNCAGCHFTGFALAGDSTNGWIASAVSDDNGTIDYDGDGDLEEINTGCEVCHGPGSEHAATAGGAIVHPGLITPERENMICGRCHGRPIGKKGTEVPDNDDGYMMQPGNSRSYFLTNHTNGVLYDADPSKDIYLDRDEHSKSHHQQYTDFLRSSHYKNQDQLVTCTDCHDMHGTDNFRSMKATTSDNALCTASCHSDKATVTAHTEDKLGTSTDMSAKCVDCHMSKYAKTGAGGPGAGSYWENDVTGHLFTVPLKTTSIVAGQTVSDSLMPLPYTNSCGSTCHDTDLSDN